MYVTMIVRYKKTVLNAFFFVRIVSRLWLDVKCDREAHAEAGGSEPVSRPSLQDYTQKLEGQLMEVHLGFRQAMRSNSIQ